MILAGTDCINIDKTTQGRYKYPLFGMVFICLCLIRNRLGWYAILWDNLICVTGLIVYKHVNIYKPIRHTLEFIGKHSMNIFLFHTFIYHYYFKDLIFFSHNPIIIYVTLLIVCLTISVVLETIKNNIGFYKL